MLKGRTQMSLAHRYVEGTSLSGAYSPVHVTRPAMPSSCGSWAISRPNAAVNSSFCRSMCPPTSTTRT